MHFYLKRKNASNCPSQPWLSKVKTKQTLAVEDMRNNIRAHTEAPQVGVKRGKASEGLEAEIFHVLYNYVRRLN